MKLLSRVSELVTANLNDLIDQCEDPEKMLRQAVREMEACVRTINRWRGGSDCPT